MIQKLFLSIIYRLRKYLCPIIPINQIKNFSSQRNYIGLENHIIKKFIIADGEVINRKMHNGLEDPVAHQWVCNPSYGFLISKGYINSKTGMLYVDTNKYHFVDTIWTWSRFSEKFDNKKTRIINSDKPLYIFSNKKYHGIFEDVAHILALIDLGYDFNIAISKTNKWMIEMLKVFLGDSKKFIFFDDFDRWIYCDKLIVTTKSFLGEFINPFFLKKLNKASQKILINKNKVNNFPKKIFISREDSRIEFIMKKNLSHFMKKKVIEK